MRLSFSTRGWGDLSWEEMMDAALDMKFTGIEVYNLWKFPELLYRTLNTDRNTVVVENEDVIPEGLPISRARKEAARSEEHTSELQSR